MKAQKVRETAREDVMQTAAARDAYQPMLSDDNELSHVSRSDFVPFLLNSVQR
jgi:hypothetical protein